MGVRYFCGVKLTDEALKYWFAQASTAEQSGRGNKGASALTKEVNKNWDPRKEKDDDVKDEPEIPF
jgi:hypothetical protein